MINMTPPTILQLLQMLMVCNSIVPCLLVLCPGLSVVLLRRHRSDLERQSQRDHICIYVVQITSLSKCMHSS